jgi:hypothetical protein
MLRKALMRRSEGRRSRHEELVFSIFQYRNASNSRARVANPNRSVEHGKFAENIDFLGHIITKN